MADKRYIYKIIINEEKRITKDKCFYYNYGQTKGIELSIFKGAATIRSNMTVKYKAEEVIYKNLFKDAIVKSLLVYLLKNNASLYIKNIYIEVYDNIKAKKLISRYSYGNKDKAIIYSMLKDNLEHPIKELWTNEEIQNLLKLKKSYGDRREIALKSFLNSKSKKYESERFLSLWMAFNGMYGYLGDKARASDIKKYKRVSDAKEIKLIQKFLGYLPGRVISGHGDKLIRHIRPMLVEFYRGNLNRRQLENGNKDYKELSLKIENYLYDFFMNLDDSQKNQGESSEILLLESYTYLLTQFTYKFRCNYFHASSPMPLFIYADDPDLICLMAMNDLLEDFIEENLHYWFSEDGIKEIDIFIDKLYEEEKNKYPYDSKNYFYLEDNIKERLWTEYKTSSKIRVGDHLTLSLYGKGENRKFLIKDKDNNQLGYLPDNLFSGINKLTKKKHKISLKILMISKNFKLNKNILVCLERKNLEPKKTK